VNDKYKSMTVDTLSVGGKVVWSKAAEEEMMRTIQP
jgi:hypothetical protein